MYQALARLHNLAQKPGRIAHAQLFRWRHRSNVWFSADYQANQNRLLENLDEVYARYTAEISSPSMAISLELACFLFYVCERRRPHVILDLGSGLSSVILRLYATQQSVEAVVHSVDDNPLWLRKTEDFLRDNSLAQINLMQWDSFSQSSSIKADLILHDLGSSQRRCEIMPLIQQYAHQDSLLIIDDIHKPQVRDAAMEMIKAHSLRYIDLKTLTLDRFGRYQWLVFGFRPETR